MDLCIAVLQVGHNVVQLVVSLSVTLVDVRDVLLVSILSKPHIDFLGELHGSFWFYVKVAGKNDVLVLGLQLELLHGIHELLRAGNFRARLTVVAYKCNSLVYFLDVRLDNN